MKTCPFGKCILTVMFVALTTIFLSDPGLTQSYSRTGEFRPLRFSYDDLANILMDTERMLTSINSGASLKIRRTIEVKSNGIKITFAGPDQLKKTQKKPEVAYEFEYRYYLDEGKITLLNLSLSDWSRKLVVEGADPNQVDALFAMLKEKIEGKQVFTGGPGFNVFFVIACLIGAFIFIAVLGETESHKGTIPKIILIIIFLVILPITAWRMDFFPGTAIYSGDASFIVRYSSHLTFLGLLLTIAFFLYGHFFPRRKADVTPKAPANNAE